MGAREIGSYHGAVVQLGDQKHVLQQGDTFTFSGPLRGTKWRTPTAPATADELMMAVAAAAGSELAPTAAREQLAKMLVAARIAAGKPLLARLANKVGYSESMLSRVMNGRLVPPRDKLEQLAEQLDVDMSTYTSIWLPLWTAASRKPDSTATSTPEAQAPAGPPGAPAGGFECPACGSWVTNPARHIEWHMPQPSAGQSGATVTPLRPAQ
jgi:transcriptional regulator with XRE-family HTH domain